MTNIKLKYHDTYIEVPVPHARFLGMLEGKEIASLKDPQKVIIDSLDKPIESAPLRAMIPPDGRIAIMVSDRTRNTRLDILLPLLFSYLNACGVKDDRILVMVCLGTHKCHTAEGLQKHIGARIFERCCVNESNHEEDDAYIHVGTTPKGTKVRFRRDILDSKLLIVTGGITFHYFAGYSGGRKSFIPGIASCDTVQQNHRMTYIETSDGRFVRNPACKSGNLDGNPVSEDMEDAFRLMPVPSFLVNVILNPRGEISGVFTGDVIKAHRKGTNEFKRLFTIPIDSCADFIIASAGGYPTDINLLQSHKSLVNASMAVKPGGRIYLAARCVEGINLDKYPEFVRVHGHEKLIDELQRNYEISGGTTDNLMTIAKTVKTFLTSGLADDDVLNLGMIPFDPSRESWDTVFDGLGNDTTYYVMPNASKFMPIINDDR